MLGTLRSGEWVPHSDLKEAGISGGVAPKTVANLLDRMRDYGVAARRGTYDGRERKDWREYRLLPESWLNKNARVWVDVPANFKCPCGSPAVGRFKSKHTGNWNWMCSAHMEASK